MTVFYVSLCISVACLFLRLWIVRRLVNFPVKQYIIEVFGKCVAICVLSLIIPLAVHIILPQSFVSIVVVCSLSIIASIVTIYYVGLDGHEKNLFTILPKKRYSIKK